MGRKKQKNILSQSGTSLGPKFHVRPKKISKHVLDAKLTKHLWEARWVGGRRLKISWHHIKNRRRAARKKASELRRESAGKREELRKQARKVRSCILSWLVFLVIAGVAMMRGNGQETTQEGKYGQEGGRAEHCQIVERTRWGNSCPRKVFQTKGEG